MKKLLVSLFSLVCSLGFSQSSIDLCKSNTIQLVNKYHYDKVKNGIYSFEDKTTEIILEVGIDDSKIKGYLIRKDAFHAFKEWFILFKNSGYEIDEITKDEIIYRHYTGTYLYYKPYISETQHQIIVVCGNEF